MTTTPKVAENLTVIGEEYAVRGTLFRHGKWASRVEEMGDVYDAATADRVAERYNDHLRQVGRKPDVKVVTRTHYASEWEATS